MWGIDLVTDLFSEGSYFGLSGLTLSENVIHFPRGIKLERTYAYVMAPVILAFAPAEKGKPHPAPWRYSRSSDGDEITAQLYIPASAASSHPARLRMAWTALFLLRLWVSPTVRMLVSANLPFPAIAHAPDEVANIIQLDKRPWTFPLQLVDESKVLESINWAVENFDTALRLTSESEEFRLAVYALDSGQFSESSTLALVSIWGALEAIFSPSTSELRFRVSALIAAYLYPPGVERMEQQKRIASLYDKRSAAVHGKPKHESDDLLITFELVRKVLIKFIRDGKVPTKADLEARLFGIS
ncbi:HEPN domain-containing protein [Mesorhizobium temperatum]|uniref:Uncharacterized protein n=1 Tax=Mesorhizobium temperatum TaxID=241416 RepID=A0A271LJ48_9HYPH|nr:HEPN domain-containing protein [Mesorhizobium temperatum]PAQ08139.1 hypothetical protein CIT26_19455 [Mesorhizobium temperatum]